MKIVVLDGYTLNPGDLSWEALEAYGDLKVYDRTDEDQIVERIANCEIVFTNKTPITESVLKACPNIKFICVLATGYNVVNVQMARDLKIPVCNIPTYGTDAVAQYVFALLLALCHRVEAHSESVFEGEWSKSLDFCYWQSPLMELVGKTMGIIGFGRIGKRTAEIANAFGMKVMAYARHPDLALASDQLCYGTLEEIYEHSDVISLHLPLVEETQGMIDEVAISKMKTGVILINTSRGPLIVESDLVAALKAGKIRSAALDVVSVEPIEETSILLEAPNLIITPHIAWAPKEARERLLHIAVDNLKLFLEGTPINVVNE
ncbi:D-2-hydroxyacid dehydrogenase [Fusibacter ferrireducens]|uniref:D-2-hydroxyacid dehydrogenase n=1 Tax=Fusibacter ferrireducens TaxID=2785058 RepID=A0ABR9ZSN9_9FIRM|nr:D-2-hydroxyacid dehydrogenase [Fusibacter ferrireducens]MBF4693473.1 D-2-hydroxyacid dehydrogenase [Fusibacter ferrireducens]